jgi:hypothetical protein
LLSSDAWKAIKKEFKEAEEMEKKGSETSQYKLSDIDRLTFAVSGKGETVQVIRTKKDVKVADVLAEVKAKFKGSDIKIKETAVAGHTLCVPDAGSAFCVVSSRLILMGDGKTLKAVLERGKKPEFSATFDAAFRAADFSKTAAAAFDVAGLAGAAKKSRDRGEPPPVLGELPLPGDLLQEITADRFLEAIQGFALDVKVGSDVAVRATVICKEATTAEDLRKTAEAGLVFAKAGAAKENAPREVIEMIEAVKVASSGKNMTMTATLKTASLIKAIKENSR